MIRFSKLQGIGNDFVVIDSLREASLPPDLPAFAKRACDRRFGIGGDGIILLEKGEQAPYRMRMLNPDGSEAEMCGNGLRCMARMMVDHGYVSEPHMPVETGAGVLDIEFLPDQRFRIDVGPAGLTRGDVGMTGPADEQFFDAEIGGYNGTAVSIGNPHLVLFMDDVAPIDLVQEGPPLERHPLFPNRINVHFAQVVDRNTLIQRTWERGAGVTLACGTGACSVAVAGFVTGRSNRKVEVRLPGGNLEIEYLESGNVLMTGPAEKVFDGEIEA